MAFEFHEELYKATVSAAQRSRRVLLLLQLYSAVVAVFWINSSEYNFLDDRLSLLKTERAIYECAPQSVLRIIQEPNHHAQSDWPWLWQRSVPDGQTLPRAGVRHVEKSSCDTRIAKPWADACAASSAWARSSGLDTEKIKMAAAHICREQLSYDDVVASIRRVDQSRQENVMTLRVPLVGLAVDLNYFGLTAGIAHVFLLAWLLVSLRQEAMNFGYLTTELPIARAAVQAHMLFAPTAGDSSRLYRNLLALLTYCGIVLPFLLLCVATLEDFRTYDTVARSLPLARNVFWLELIPLATNAVLVFFCIKAYNEAARVYRDPTLFDWLSASYEERSRWLQEKIGTSAIGMTVSQIQSATGGVSEAKLTDFIRALAVGDGPLIHQVSGTGKDLWSCRRPLLEVVKSDVA